MIPSRWCSAQGVPVGPAGTTNTRLRVRPLDHGIKPGAPGPVGRCPMWTLSMKPSPCSGLVRAGNAIGFHLVAWHTLRTFPDPPRLRVGTSALKCTPGSSGGSSGVRFAYPPFPGPRAKRPGGQIPPPNRKSSTVRIEVSVRPVRVRVPPCKVTVVLLLCVGDGEGRQISHPCCAARCGPYRPGNR